MFDNDIYYRKQLNATIQTRDISDIKYSCFVKSGQTYFQKYGFYYSDAPMFDKDTKKLYEIGNHVCRIFGRISAFDNQV